MGSQDELRRLFKEILDEREPVRPITHGLLGDGLGNLWVPGDSDNRVWFRKNGQTSQLSKVHCWRVRPIYEMPVICGYTTEEPTFYQVLTCDRDKLELAWQGMSTVPRHAETHIWADTLGGDDPVMIWTRALMPFRVSPQATPDLTVQIQGPEVYLWLTGWQEWLGDAIVDLTASVPGAGLGLHRYTLIYIDGATSTAMTLDGAAVGAAVPLPPGSWPAPPSGSIPVGLVHLSSDQTTITEDDIVDGRVVVGSAGGSITPAAHHLIDDTVHDDTEAYAAPTRGEIVRFNTDWERYDASTLGAVLIGDGTDVISDTTPTFVGVVTFNAGITMGGASGVNELTIPGNQAIAFELLDTNAIEYLRIDTAPQLEVIWNFGEADMDFNIRAGAGISDPTDAFFVEGSTGFVFMGDIAPTYIGHLTLADLAINTTASYRGAALHHVKTAGVTDHNDIMYGMDCIMQLNQVGGVVSYLYGLRFEAEITAGDVGTVVNNRSIAGIWGITDLRGGTVHGDAYGIGAIVSQQIANTVTSDIFVGYLEGKFPGTVTGTVYMHFLQEDGSSDFGYYQTTSAGVAGANYLEGKLTLASAELEFTAATGLNLIEFPDALANALYFADDTTAINFQQFITTAAGQAVVFNIGEQDVDFRVAASGITNAIFVQGSSGAIGVGAVPTASRNLHIQSLASLGFTVASATIIMPDSAVPDATNYYGYLGGVDVTGAGNLTSAFGQSGVMGQIRSLTASAITNVTALRTDIRFSGAAATGNIVTGTGLTIGNPVNAGGAAGTMGTFIGIFAANLTFAATNYFMFSLGGRSYHAGTLAVGGTNSVAAQLYVDQSNAAGNIPAVYIDQGDTGEACVIFSSDAADRDIDLWRVNVGGVPTWFWDESQDGYSSNKGLRITRDGQALGLGSAAALTADRFIDVDGSLAGALTFGIVFTPSTATAAGTIYACAGRGDIDAAVAASQSVAFYAFNPGLGGGATVTNAIGLRVASLTAGTSNYAVYTDPSTPSYFGGRVAVGGTVVALAQLHVDQSLVGGAIPVALFDQADLSEEFFELTTTVGAGNPIDTAAHGVYYGKVRVMVTGVGYKVLALYEES